MRSSKSRLQQLSKLIIALSLASTYIGTAQTQSAAYSTNVFDYSVDKTQGDYLVFTFRPAISVSTFQETAVSMDANLEIRATLGDFTCDFFLRGDEITSLSSSLENHADQLGCKNFVIQAIAIHEGGISNLPAFSEIDAMASESLFVVAPMNTLELGQESVYNNSRTRAILPVTTAPGWVPVSGYTRAFERTIDNTARIFSVITFPKYTYRQDAAYEHDIKTTMDNAGIGTRPFCFFIDDHSGWAYRYGTSFITDLPLPYFDTNASDSCDSIDLTVGSYAIASAAGKTFSINTISQRGSATSSHYALNAQMLQNTCDIKNTPMCVGIQIPSWAASYLLIGSTNGVMPGCRAWSAGSPSEPC